MTKVKAIPNDILLSQVRDLLLDGKHVTINAKGSSMRPFIVGDRDSVTLESCPAPRVGDILLCEVSKGEFVLHRAIRINDGEVVLMGDGNLQRTETCNTRDVAGKVTRIIRPDGKEIRCDSRHARLCSRIWILMLPFRRYLLALHGKAFPAAKKQ